MSRPKMIVLVAACLFLAVANAVAQDQPLINIGAAAESCGTWLASRDGEKSSSKEAPQKDLYNLGDFGTLQPWSARRDSASGCRHCCGPARARHSSPRPSRARDMPSVPTQSDVCWPAWDIASRRI